MLKKTQTTRQRKHQSSKHPGDLEIDVVLAESTAVWKTSSDVAPQPPQVPKFSWNFRTSSLYGPPHPCDMCLGTHRSPPRAKTHRAHVSLKTLEHESLNDRRGVRGPGHWDFRKMGYDMPITARSSYTPLTGQRHPLTRGVSFDHFEPLPAVKSASVCEPDQEAKDPFGSSSSSDEDGQDLDEQASGHEAVHIQAASACGENGRREFLDLVRDDKLTTGGQPPEDLFHSDSVIGISRILDQDRRDVATPIGRHRYWDQCARQSVLPLAAVPIWRQRTGLNLNSYMLGTRLVKAFSESIQVNKQDMTVLNLANNRLQPTDCQQVLKALLLPTPLFNKTPITQTLVTLNLTNNTVGKLACGILSELLRTSASLRHLQLASCGLGDKLAAGLCDTISGSMLESCDLSKNKLGNTAAMAAAAMVRWHTRLTCLRVGYNQFRVEGSTALIQAVTENTSLTELDMSWNSIGLGCNSAPPATNETSDDLADEDAPGHVCTSGHDDSSGYHAAEALKQLIETNNTLLCLNLSHTNLGQIDGLMLVSSLIANNGTLCRLVLDSNPIGATAVPALLHAFRLQTGCFISTTNCDFTISTPPKVAETVSMAHEHWRGPIHSCSYSFNLANGLDRTKAQLLALQTQQVMTVDSDQETTTTGHAGGALILSPKLDGSPVDLIMIPVTSVNSLVLPPSGILSFDFVVRANSNKPAIPAQFWNTIGRMLHALQPGTLRLALKHCCVNRTDVEPWLQQIPTHQRAETLQLMWGHIKPQTDLHVLALDVLGDEYHSWITNMGPLSTFNPSFASGHYQLRMNSYCDRLLLRELQIISAESKHKLTLATGSCDHSQAGDLEGFRNVRYESEPYHISSESQSPEEDGLLELDFVQLNDFRSRNTILTPSAPPKLLLKQIQAHAGDDATGQSLRQWLHWQQKFDLDERHLYQIVLAIAGSGCTVETIVSLWSLVSTPEVACQIFHECTGLEQRELVQRISPLAFLDPSCPDGHWSIDLSRADGREFSSQLIQIVELEGSVFRFDTLELNREEVLAADMKKIANSQVQQGRLEIVCSRKMAGHDEE
eukprot:TRINITY_DN24191_c0_g2_i6.p1 TRINITY_DN24191_c0_g2~~TRINITY_DN24191_c0_g2_i6.p1  ORF type:complete len:1063 (-),score=124.53 TRINITY_DN24191_c0_g2_i6:258-3446(-)